MSEAKLQGRTPVWMTVLIILMVIPVVPFYILTGASDANTEEIRYLIKIFPAFVILSGVCAYLSYPGRRELAWILIVLLALSYLAMWYLI